MTDRAKVFMSGRSQSIRLPVAYWFDTDEVFIRRDETTGDIVLSARPKDWGSFFALAEQAGENTDFLVGREQDSQPDRDPFDGVDG